MLAPPPAWPICFRPVSGWRNRKDGWRDGRCQTRAQVTAQVCVPGWSVYVLILASGAVCGWSSGSSLLCMVITMYSYLARSCVIPFPEPSLHRRQTTGKKKKNSARVARPVLPPHPAGGFFSFFFLSSSFFFLLSSFFLFPVSCTRILFLVSEFRFPPTCGSPY